MSGKRLPENIQQNEPSIDHIKTNFDVILQILFGNCTSDQLQILYESIERQVWYLGEMVKEPEKYNFSPSMHGFFKSQVLYFSQVRELMPYWIDRFKREGR
jgi:hypothetical protein